MSYAAAFWAKVETCQHEWSDTYYDSGGCGTPLCEGWLEVHCKKCGVYDSHCPCGSENGQSGWPHRRWRRLEMRQKATRRKGSLSE
jgi:hypothetical protein